MNNAYTRSFTHSRIILTLWYIVFCLALIALLNFGAFAAQTSSLQAPAKAIGFGDSAAGAPQDTIALIKTDSTSITTLDTIRKRFGYTLIIADSALLVFAIVFSYILAGITLKPIRKVMQQQEEFAQEASHELRTPLSIIAMEVETLKRDRHTSDPDTITHIDNELKRMNRLIDGLLTLVQPSENTKQARQTRTFDITRSAKAVFLKLKKVANSKQLHYSFASEYSGDIVANQHDIEQVISILLENAIKYSSEHSSISLEIKSPTGRGVSIVISDTGTGIAKEDLPHVFDRFYRGRDTDMNTAGLGLGLAIAKKLVTLQKGRITIDSVAGKGTTARIYLPVK